MLRTEVLPVSDEDEQEDIVAVDALRRVRNAVRTGVSPKPAPEAPRRRQDDPRPLGEAVAEFMTEQGFDDRHRVTRVLADWAGLVGPEVAEHVQVEAFDDGELVLRADSTAWANQMRLLSATVQRRLAEQLGADLVQQLKVLGPEAPSWRHGSRYVPGRGPRDTYG